MKHLLSHLSLMAFCCSSVACNNSTTSEPKTYTGVAQAVGTGTVNSWVSVDASGNLTAIGITVSDAALATLPSGDQMFEIPMPVGLNGVPFKSVGLEYVTTDKAPYNNPHLDAHFYFLDMAHRMDIHAGMDSMMPNGMMMPSGYEDMWECEEMMGVHWIDTTSSEWHGQPFRCAFVYGFSKGYMTFMEAMCDKALLQSHTGYNGIVRQPTMMSGMGGMMMMTHAKGYSVSYDVNAKCTNIQLSGFTQ